MKTYHTVAENPHTTVVAEYTPPYGSQNRPQTYQSEADLERAFIEQLQAQAYERLSIRSEDDLIANLRRQLEKLNGCAFSDNEWKHFFKEELANPNQRIEEKTASIQEDYIKTLRRDDGTTKNIYLLKKDTATFHDNSVQVINQYAADAGTRPNRYDVTVLVNGLPLAHIELKRRGVALQEAFNQIRRYQRESFWAASGLFEYVQLFVISNGTHTKYYSNTTRYRHVRETHKKAATKGKRSSHSFEFTNWWADAANTPIADLMDFAKTFFAKRTLLSIVIRYCVFTSERQLLAMRPYQIAATERIISRIKMSSSCKKAGSKDAGGYIWHTTGSGKTLTSFKTAQLASKLSCIDKTLFVVDRKDLDYQTMVEYDKFEKGAANSNASTHVLKRQLGDPDARIIVTTIQKLDRFIKGYRSHPVFGARVALIFDECHRSQFGDMHKAITKAFKKYHLFGFTGTPIFADDAASGGDNVLNTTEQVFGDRLHTYTIVNAIADKNVLPFKVDYVSTFREAENITDEQVRDIDREAALSSPERVAHIVNYICEHFDQKTKRNASYTLKDRRLKGFNSLFATASIDAAKKYYDAFKQRLAQAPTDKKLKIALIYSFGANEAQADGVAEENAEDTSGLDVGSRDFLEAAIDDYNVLFGTSYDTSSSKFPNYYKDVSRRVKDRELDMLIVVNMFLTGFDATTLNTLWVDKNLRLHGLLQAYSRTNRMLNSVKTFGNIVCFRNLEQATNRAIARYGDKEAGGIALLRTYDDYYHGYTDGDEEVKGYKRLIEELLDDFPVGKTIVGEQAQKDFIKRYGAILKLRNILSSFDEFEGHEILSRREEQDYQSMYIDLYETLRKPYERGEKEYINDDLVFEMELIKQVEINIDHILELIEKYHHDNVADKEALTDIRKAVDASMELRNKKDLIEAFIQTLSSGSRVDESWRAFVEEQKKKELERIIASEDLDRDKAYAFVQNAFRDGFVSETGTGLAEILPPTSLFTPEGDYAQKREQTLDKLQRFFDRFFAISGKNVGA